MVRRVYKKLDVSLENITVSLRLYQVTHQEPYRKLTLLKMMSVRIVLVIAIVTLILATVTEAAYKKPPFNGSIFGKRSYAVADYEAVGRALSAMCEVASETCNAWLMHQDSN